MISRTELTTHNLDRLTYSTLRHIQSKKIFSFSYGLEREIQTLDPKTLSQFVDKVVSEIMQEKEALLFLKKFAELLPANKLETATKQKFITLEDTLARAVKVAKRFEKIPETKGIAPSATSVAKHETQHIFFSILEGFLDKIGIVNLFDEEDSKTDTAKKVAILLGLATAVCAVLVPLVAVSHAMLITGGIMLLVIGFGHAYPKYLQPMPRFVQGMNNLSLQYQEGKLQGYASSPTALLLANALHPKEKALLLAEEPERRKHITHSLVHAIATGKAPHLSGKTVFSIHAAQLSAQNLSRIRSALGTHKENVVLIIEDIHILFGNAAFETLLAELSSFPYVIGVSQESRFDAKLTKTPEFADLFDRLVRMGAISLDERKAILYQQAREKKAAVSASSLDHLAMKTAHMPLKTAKEILQACVDRTSRARRSRLDDKVDQAFHSIVRLHERAKFGDPDASFAEELQELGTRREALNELARQREEERAFIDLRSRILEARESTIAMAKKLAGSKSPEDRDKSFFLLLSHHYAPAMTKALEKQGELLGIPISIDEALIDEIIAESTNPLEINHRIV